MFVSLSHRYIPKISATLYKYGGVYLASLSVIASVKIFSSCFFKLFVKKSKREILLPRATYMLSSILFAFFF